MRWLARTRLRRWLRSRRAQRAERLRRRETGQQPSFRGRRVTVVSAFAVIGLVMLSGAIERQILEVDFLQKEGARRYLTRIDIPVHRGLITDRDGAILAASAPVDSIWADPRALRLALDACETYERLGSPEGELALAEAVIYLAMAPKSNAAYVAYGAAQDLIKTTGTLPVPLHLRNAPTRLMKNLGYGRDYRYAHDEFDAYAAGEDYFPDGMAKPGWYKPSDRGLEARIAEKLAHLRSLDRKEP